MHLNFEFTYYRFLGMWKYICLLIGTWLKKKKIFCPTSNCPVIYRLFCPFPPFGLCFCQNTVVPTYFIS